MKELLKDILWYWLNKLDPLKITKVDISNKEIKIIFKKNFLRKNKWEHVSLNISFWVMKTKDIQTYNEIELYKNSKLKVNKKK